jgi:hypothetical protein
MIFVAYTDPQWDRIKVAVRDALGLDADQIEREITPVIRKSLRSCIEFAVSQYSPATNLQRRRAKLSALRKNIENQRADIINAFTVEVGRKGGTFAVMLLPGVDADMVTSTNDYFKKLERNLDRQIEQAGQRGDNARKTARDNCWNELLAIWCELGGKASGKATAGFLIVASKPVMGSAVPDITSVMRWLERHRDKTANKDTKPGLRWITFTR